MPVLRARSARLRGRRPKAFRGRSRGQPPGRRPSTTRLWAFRLAPVAAGRARGRWRRPPSLAGGVPGRDGASCAGRQGRDAGGVWSSRRRRAQPGRRRGKAATAGRGRTCRPGAAHELSIQSRAAPAVRGVRPRKRDLARLSWQGCRGLMLDPQTYVARNPIMTETVAEIPARLSIAKASCAAGPMRCVGAKPRSCSRLRRELCDFTE